MDTRHDTRPLPGLRVIDSNNHLLGTVESVEHDLFVVGAGLFFAEPQRVPASAISDIRDQELRQRITREDALHSSIDTRWAERQEHGEIVEPPPDTDGFPG